MLGRSLENILLEQIQDGAKSIPPKSLATLAQLQAALKQAGQEEAAQALGEFLGDARRGQLMNIKPDPTPGQGQWSEIGFTLRDGAKSFLARLKIAHEARAESSKINPAYTRLILQVDLNPDETVEVDLSLVGKQIRAAMVAEDAAWRKAAQEELPSLEAALGGLGYQLDEAQIGAGKPQPFEKIQIPTGGAPLLTVNIEV
jgi:flagellar hook-length control protein FliK